MGDTGNALLAAIAITSALYHRDRTGEGQEVGTSIVNAGLLHTSYAWIHADGSPGDWAHVDAGQFGLSPYYRMYECADGVWLFLRLRLVGASRRGCSRDAWYNCDHLDRTRARGHEAMAPPARQSQRKTAWPRGQAVCIG